YIQRKGQKTKNLTGGLLPQKPTTGERAVRPKMTTLSLEPEDRVYFLQQEVDPLTDEAKDLSDEIDNAGSSTVAGAADIAKKLSANQSNAVILRVPRAG
ncbi:hypothetical protein KBD18_01185, partial [Patescibacteria group bacterium]|nr:hypothetical protein [Patescibacteria group bacterium]